MCGPALLPAAIIGSAIVGAGASIYSGSKARKAARKAQAANQASADREAQRAETAFNKANQKTPDIAAMMDRNRRGAQGGMGSTFLTGPSGVQPSLLARPALLGA